MAVMSPLLIIFLAFAAFCCSTPPSSTRVWQQLHIGAGGFMRGGGCVSDGTCYVRSDTYAGYIKTPGATQWHQVMTQNSMPSPVNTNFKSVWGGAYELVVCGGNTNVAYMIAIDGNMYKSTNAQSANTDAITWTLQSGWTTQSVAPNGNNAQFGNFMSCDQNNTAGNVVVVGLQTAGTFFTTNGGTTWTNITTGNIPTPSGNGYSLTAFDYTSSVTGSGSTAQTQGVYITSYNNGLFHSTTGLSGTFSAVASAPTTFRHLIVDTTGKVWVVDDSSGELHSFNGSWTDNIGSLSGLWSVAIDPNTSGSTTHIVVSATGTQFSVSTNNGGSFTTIQGTGSTTVANGDTPWLAGTYNSADGNHFQSQGNIFFDPLTSGQLNFVGGQYGFMTTNPTANLAGPTITHTPFDFGIEQTDTAFVLAPPNGGSASNVIAGIDDLGVFYKGAGTFNVNAASFWSSTIGSQYKIVPGISADWCPGTGFANIVALIQGVNGSPDLSSASANGGLTWTQFGSVPATTNTQGGNIVCASANGQNLAWINYTGSSQVQPQFSTDGGTTWSPSSTTFTGGFKPPTFFGAQLTGTMMVADKNTAGNIYLYQNTGSNSTAGFYKSTTSGQAYTKIASGFLNAADIGAGAPQFACSPTVAGECFYSSGWQEENPANSPQTGEFFVKIQIGSSSITTTNVPKICEVISFGFGAQVPGQSYSRIGVLGWYNASDTAPTCNNSSFTYTFGFFELTDDGNTWTQLGTQFPLGRLAYMNSVDGDKAI